MSLRLPDSPPDSPSWQNHDGDNRTTVRLSADLLEAVEALVDAGLYKSVSEAIRDGVRRVLHDPDDGHVVDPATVSNRVTARLTTPMVAAVNGLVEDDRYPSQADVMRDGLYRVVDATDGTRRYVPEVA